MHAKSLFKHTSLQCCPQCNVQIIRITISHIFSTNGKTNFQSGKCYKVSFQKNTQGDIQRDNSPHSWDITHNFSSTSNPKSSWFKIEPPSTSLVTTACKLKTPSIKRNKSRDQRDTINYSRAKVLQKCINPPADLKSVWSWKPHLGRVTVSRTPLSLTRNNSKQLNFVFVFLRKHLDDKPKLV